MAQAQLEMYRKRFQLNNIYKSIKHLHQTFHVMNKELAEILECSACSNSQIRLCGSLKQCRKYPKQCTRLGKKEWS